MVNGLLYAVVGLIQKEQHYRVWNNPSTNRGLSVLICPLQDGTVAVAVLLQRPLIHFIRCVVFPTLPQCSFYSFLYKVIDHVASHPSPSNRNQCSKVIGDWEMS